MNYPRLKRVLDSTASLMLLALLMPLIVGIGFLVLLFQGRPIFFVQVRPGLNERPFKMVKFRTMNQNPTVVNGSRGNPETTRFGSFLRALSLDELPQLVNILRGDMSFVGPRPLLMEYLPLYSKQQRIRHNVRPGLTGLAQIAGRNEVPWEQRLALDALYVSRQSLAGDLMIVLKSVWIVITGRGVRARDAEIMPRFKGEGASGNG